MSEKIKVPDDYDQVSSIVLMFPQQEDLDHDEILASMAIENATLKVSCKHVAHINAAVDRGIREED